MSVYFDATTAIPQANGLENDSSGSHPLPDGPAIRDGATPEPGTDDSNQFGGCTPGLRRRRQGTEKYATDTAQLGLRFQRRRRHNAGPYGDSEAGANGCTPLLDATSPTPHSPMK